MNDLLYKVVKWFYVISVSMAAAAMLNVLLFIAAVYGFAGEEGGSWVEWYFGGGKSSNFIIATTLIALTLIPFTKKLNIVLK
ncbi:hypothetical protein [Sulfurovum sp.]|uniref:hypothetical protein n=1 Tax=Sulfurovum sp. TaxID=1969726 RepID=UPI0035670BCA